MNCNGHQRPLERCSQLGISLLEQIEIGGHEARVAEIDPEPSERFLTPHPGATAEEWGRSRGIIDDAALVNRSSVVPKDRHAHVGRKQMLGVLLFSTAQSAPT